MGLAAPTQHPVVMDQSRPSPKVHLRAGPTVPVGPALCIVLQRSICTLMAGGQDGSTGIRVLRNSDARVLWLNEARTQRKEKLREDWAWLVGGLSGTEGAVGLVRRPSVFG